MTLPPTMRRVAVTPAGDAASLRLEDAPLPVVSPTEVLIRAAAAGVNRPDLAQRDGRYPPPPDASPVLGLEAAGTVVARGDAVQAWPALGDAVTALCNGGGYAAYCAAPAGQCLPIPHGLDLAEAAALPENHFTVWANVFAPREVNGAALASGETLLVHGGTSGIGLAATQVARARGARVIATAGTDEKCAAARRWGAHEAINYRADADWPATVRRLTDGRGADVILDMVGGPYLARNLASLARGGRLSVIAVQGGAVADGVDLAALMQRRLTVTGATLRPRSAGEKAAIAASLRREVWPLIAGGAVRPVIERRFPLASVADAHRLMEAGHHVGKIVLTPMA